MMSNANNHDERMRLVKTFAYEHVRFNHDPNNTYLVTDVTDDCMLELKDLAGLFDPDLFQRVKDDAFNCNLSCARWVPYDEHHRRYEPDKPCTCGVAASAEAQESRVQCADCFAWVDRNASHTCRQQVSRNRRSKA